jgi:hypothetical protein
VRTSRGLLQALPSTCLTQGLVCDQGNADTASALTLTAVGVSFGGVTLVQTPNTYTWIASNDAACTSPDGEKYDFTIVASERPVLRRCLICAVLKAGLPCRMPSAACPACHQQQ